MLRTLCLPHSDEGFQKNSEQSKERTGTMAGKLKKRKSLLLKRSKADFEKGWI